MRPDLMDMTEQDWLNAMMAMNKRAFTQLKRIARVGGIKLPAFIAVQNPRITFDSVGESAQFQRVRDVEALNTFNNRVAGWTKKVESELKASAQSKFGHRQKSDALFPHLADSIKGNIRKDKKYKLETRSVGFSMARHGVFMHKGAGRGHGGYIGSKWTDKYGTLKSTSESSLGKMDTGNRGAVDWFNDVINRNIEELVNITADYSLDITVNLNSILLAD